MQALLEISAFNDNTGVNLAAAVQLGTLVEYHWKYRDDAQAKIISVPGFNYIIIPEEDKQMVRDNIVIKMYQMENRAVIKQYLRAITTISRFDYPDKWESLLTRDIAQALGSKEDRGILTGLMALFCVCKKYEFELDDVREQLYKIVQDSQEIMGQIIESYLPQIG